MAQLVAMGRCGVAMGQAEEVSAAWSGKQEEEEETSLGCPRKLKSSACSPMPERGMWGWVFLESDAAPFVGPSLQGRQLQCWVVVLVGVSQLGTGVLGSPGSPPARTDRWTT